MVGLGALSSDALETMHRFESHGTNVGGPLITDAPPLTFQQLYDRVFGELTTGQQGALPFGELSVACRAAQPFDMLVCTCPGSMCDVACTGAIEPGTVWIRAREARIFLLCWRR
jgi:hypothetical protein